MTRVMTLTRPLTSFKQRQLLLRPPLRLLRVQPELPQERRRHEEIPQEETGTKFNRENLALDLENGSNYLVNVR